MGRKKLKSQYITDDKLRNVYSFHIKEIKITFNKRKRGLLKKAAELALLCNVKVVLTFTDLYSNVYNFTAPDESAIKEIKRNHLQNNTYTINFKDYPNFKIIDYQQENPDDSSDQDVHQKMEEKLEKKIQKTQLQNKILKKGGNIDEVLEFVHKIEQSIEESSSSKDYCKQDVKEEAQDEDLPIVPQIQIDQQLEQSLNKETKKLIPDENMNFQLQNNIKMSLNQNQIYHNDQDNNQPCYFIPFGNSPQFQPNHIYPFPFQNLKDFHQLYQKNQLQVKYVNTFNKMREE